jgi:hypothetical protein
MRSDCPYPKTHLEARLAEDCAEAGAFDGAYRTAPASSRSSPIKDSEKSVPFAWYAIYDLLKEKGKRDNASQ